MTWLAGEKRNDGQPSMVVLNGMVIRYFLSTNPNVETGAALLILKSAGASALAWWSHKQAALQPPTQYHLPCSEVGHKIPSRNRASRKNGAAVLTSGCELQLTRGQNKTRARPLPDLSPRVTPAMVACTGKKGIPAPGFEPESLERSNSFPFENPIY